MSVLIKGMEMPERCGQCFLRVGKCKQRIYMEQRPKYCPLVEIPTPHGRLGDLDALIKDLAVYRGGHNEGYGFDGGMYEAYNNSIELVDNAPTVIEAEGSET